jgi:hypothetical protein
MIAVAEVIQIISLFFAGTLAGEDFVIFFCVRTPLAALDVKPQLDPSFASASSRHLCAGCLIRDRGNNRKRLRSYSSLPFCRDAWISSLGRWSPCGGTAPINSAIAEWDPNAPPENWQTTVNRWECFAAARPWAAMTAFAMLLSP